MESLPERAVGTLRLGGGRVWCSRSGDLGFISGAEATMGLKTSLDPKGKRFLTRAELSRGEGGSFPISSEITFSHVKKVPLACS